MAERKRLNAHERDALLGLKVAQLILLDDESMFKPLESRLGIIPYGKRDLGLAKSAVNRLVSNLFNSVPQVQYDTMKRHMASSGYEIGVKRPGSQTKDNDYGMWLSWNQLKVLLSSTTDKCLVCTADTQQQACCSLAKCLDSMALWEHNSSVCGYAPF